MIAPPAGGDPTPAAWRAAMGAFPSGVTIVTSWRGGDPIGSTVNAFCSVSLTPPLLLVCLDLNNPITEPLKACGRFGVNILPEDGGAAAAMHFAVEREETRFQSYPFRAARDGAPQLDLASTFIDCRVESLADAGDHVIVVGRGVSTLQASVAPPLLYHRGAFHRLPSP